MIKKITQLAMAVGALVALASPAAANAQRLTENKVAIPEGAIVYETGFNVEVLTAAGTIFCKKYTYIMTVDQNKTRYAMSGSGSGEECKVTQNGAPVTITSVIAEEFASEGEGVGEATLSFVADIAGILTCTFSGTVPITYEAESEESLVEGTLAGSGAGCPAGGKTQAVFNRETKNEVPIIAD